MQKTKRISVLILLAAIFVISACGAAVSIAYAAQPSYFVCFSHQNYAVRNANKLVDSGGGEYVLENVTLTSASDFYVTDNAGTRWYAGDNEPLSVKDAAAYAYDIKFSPSQTYDADGEWENTGCNLTYRFNVPASYSVTVNGEEKQLDFNPYFTRYELYYISSIYLNGGDELAFGEERHTILSDGFYRVLFTPGKTVSGNDYSFDSDGNYGSGDDFKYLLYIEDAPQYYVAFRDGITCGEGETVDGKTACLLTRYEKNVEAAEYRSEKFFLGERDADERYCLYEKSANGVFTLIDDDDDDKTTWSTVSSTDVGWYNFSVIDGGDGYLTALAWDDTPFGKWYLAGNFNGYGFDTDGSPDLNDNFVFSEVEDGDDDYDEDYKQYILWLTVTEQDLKDGDVEFYITDGENKYKNGAEYIALNTAGKYKILFSDEHIYGRGRNYRYTLEDVDKETEELIISSAREFCDFAQNCTKSADYSLNLKVYLSADIDFSGVNFQPVGNFSGTFYGGYHTLKNVTFTGGGEQTSVFSVVTRTGVIERLNVENLQLGTDDDGFVGFVGRNYGTLKNISVSGKITGNAYAGGVVAYNGRSVNDDDSATVDSDSAVAYGKVINCVNGASVTGTRFVGGVAGFNAGEITGCNSEGQISGNKTRSSTVINVGGIAGYSSGKIDDCQNSGKVTGGDDSLYVGGVAGMSTGEIYFSFNFGNLSATRYAGGVCGYYGTVENDNQDLNDYFGSIDYETFIKNTFGDSGDDFEQIDGGTHDVIYCANYGNITAFSYAGGVIGNTRTADLNLSNCASTGDVSVTAGSYAGGIAGYCAGAEIKSCLSSGNISAKGLGGGNYVGGIAGYCDGVSYCVSSACLKGNDYVGGIAGLANANVCGTYTNVLIIAGDDSENVGSIAGYAQAYNPSGVFPENFKGNYYIDGGDVGGIRGSDFAEGYGYAAAKIDGDKLSSKGMLSPYLCEEFSREYWQGGLSELSYPTLINFEECELFSTYGDDALCEKTFLKHAEKFSALTQDAAKLTYTVTFMEWNKDDGDLYDDGVLQTDNFTVIFTVRAYKGQQVELPAFVYATENGSGKYVYESDSAKYFVSFPEVGAVTANTTVYARYDEIVTSIHTPNDTIFVEGEFYKGTTVELLSAGDGYTLKFVYDGREITVENVTVKYLVGDDGEKFAVSLLNGAEASEIPSEVSGKYLAFTYSSGDYFRVDEVEKGAMPPWAWLLIGMGCALAACGVAYAVVFLIKRKKSKAFLEENSGGAEEDITEN